MSKRRFNVFPRWESAMLQFFMKYLKAHVFIFDLHIAWKWFSVIFSWHTSESNECYTRRDLIVQSPVHYNMITIPYRTFFLSTSCLFSTKVACFVKHCSKHTIHKLHKHYINVFLMVLSNNQAVGLRIIFDQVFLPDSDLTSDKLLYINCGHLKLPHYYLSEFLHN